MKICIVGGGSAGWMSATTFSRCLDCEITVVESPNVPTSGVGESTLFEIQDWMNLVGIDRDELVRKTNGTYKHSIKFTNWLKKDSGSFHYPFGEHPNFSPERWWEFHTKNEDKVSPNDYGTMLNVVGTIAEKGKFDEVSPYAYHFDAVKFANLLKDGLEGAVEYISGDVVDWESGEEGIKSLKLDNGESVEADLFVDCTGFKSLLLGQFLEEPFISYNDVLPNDRAWATHVPYNDKNSEMVPYTECTAIDNGWVWQIPLWEEIGTGYVYSSKYISDEDAKQEFIEHLKEKGFDPSGCEFTQIPMRIGRHERTFVKNVVAIGLSSGFIEPLESNGLLTVHHNLMKLYKTLRRGKPSQLVKDFYNSAVMTHFDTFAEFIMIHYGLTQREDTSYWKDNFDREYEIRGQRMKDNVFGLYGLLSYSQELFLFDRFQYPGKGFHYIASGMNLSPYIFEFEGPVFNILENTQKWDEGIANLPTMYNFLKDYVYGDKARPISPPNKDHPTPLDKV